MHFDIYCISFLRRGCQIQVLFKASVDGFLYRRGPFRSYGFIFASNSYFGSVSK